MPDNFGYDRGNTGRQWIIYNLGELSIIFSQSLSESEVLEVENIFFFNKQTIFEICIA